METANKYKIYLEGLALGVINIVFGILVIFKRGYYSSQYGYYIDFGVFHKYIGAIISIWGLVFSWLSIRKSNIYVKIKELFFGKSEININNNKAKFGLVFYIGLIMALSGFLPTLFNINNSIIKISCSIIFIIGLKLMFQGRKKL
jgi:hypothetical protein